MTAEGEHDAQQTSRKAQSQIEAPALLFAKPHTERHLACTAVVVDVAIVVHHEQSVDDQTAGNGSDKHLDGQRMHDNIVRYADRHDSEKHQHQHIAKAVIAQVGGVEETEDNAQQTDNDHLPSAIPHQRQTYQTGDGCRQQDGTTHAGSTHPPHRTGSLRTEAGLVVVAADEVEIVVDKVGVNLHHECKQQTQHSGQPCKRKSRCPAVAVSQSQRYHYRHSSSRQRLRTGCQQPCLRTGDGGLSPVLRGCMMLD